MRRPIPLLVAAFTLLLASCEEGTEQGRPNASVSTPAGTIAMSGSPSASISVHPGTMAMTGASSGIMLIDTDGTAFQELTFVCCDGQADWSPDGTRIAYSSGFGPSRSNIRVMKADGSEDVLLTGTKGGDSPAWSPDGTEIAFSGELYGGQAGVPAHIYVMGADGSDLLQVTDGTVVDVLPTWTPDGAILFLRVDAGGYGDVFAVRPDGKGLAQVTSGWRVGGYELSPDGTQIAIQDGERDRIVVLPVGPGPKVEAGATPVTLVDTAAAPLLAEDRFLHLTWSPDGEALAVAGDTIRAYVWMRDFAEGLYIVNADGSGLTAVPNAETALDPDWRPD